MFDLVRVELPVYIWIFYLHHNCIRMFLPFWFAIEFDIIFPDVATKYKKWKIKKTKVSQTVLCHWESPGDTPRGSLKLAHRLISSICCTLAQILTMSTLQMFRHRYTTKFFNFTSKIISSMKSCDKFSSCDFCCN